MKYLLGAAAAAIALSTVSTSGHANNDSWGLVTNYDTTVQEVTALDHLWSSVKLKHTSATIHNFAPPAAGGHGGHLSPPDPCKIIADAWNFAVLLRARDQTFEHLLTQIAHNQCTINFDTTGATNPDGSLELDSVAPENQ